MDFFHYYTNAFKPYVNFKGRVRRRDYWMFVLINFIISLVLSLVTGIFGESASSITGLLYGLAVLIPSLGLGFRRLHDTNRSAWWLLLAFIPIIGAIILIVFLALDSTPGANKYGPNPKEIAMPTPPPAAAPAPVESQN